MKARIEFRRHNGSWVARYRKTEGLKGELQTVRREHHDRQVWCLQLTECDTAKPELYEPRLTNVFGNEIRFMGWEITPAGAWVVQEWDCILLPP